MKSVKVSGVLLYLFGLSLVLLLYINYVFLPLNQKVSALSREHLTDRGLIQSYELQPTQTDDLRQEINKLKTRLKEREADTALTGNSIAEDIGKIASSSGVTLKSISVGEEQAVKGKTAAGGKQLYTVSVELNVLCTPSQLPALAGYFENRSKGVYCIDRVKYTTDTAEAGKLNASLTMTLYYFSEGAGQ